ncbi:unnamed protein product, partial [Staurois parvus]
MSCQSAPARMPPHQFHLISTHQCSLSVPISVAYQCP